MFIPNTYEFYWTVTPEEFVERMKREYDRFWTPERGALRKRSGLSRFEVMTLASIVYEETRKTDEMPRRRRRIRQPAEKGNAPAGRPDDQIRDGRISACADPCTSI